MKNILIILFRYMLKSLGLWKSTNDDILSQVEPSYNYQELYGNEEGKSIISRDKRFSPVEVESMSRGQGEIHINMEDPEDNDRSDV